MANSTTNIDGVVQSQSSKEVTINAFFDAASPASLYARRQSTTTGLTWGYYGGNATKGDGTMTQVANGTLALTGSTTNYIVAAKSTGAVSVSTATTNWDNSTDYWRLYSVATGSATVTSYTDSRELGKMTGGGSGTGTTNLGYTDATRVLTSDTGTDVTLPLVTTANAGLAPASGGGTTNFLRADATWAAPSGGAITVKDEGSNLTTALESLDFVGAGVTATNTGGAVTVTVSGSGSSITIKDEGGTLTTSPTSIDFVGGGVTATNSGGAVTVTVPTGGGRELLTGARTYYVRTDGSDSNNGLANTSGGAFLTIQKAIDVASSIDNGGYDITIRVVAGTYTVSNTLKTFVGSGRIVIRGDTADLTSTVISPTSADCFNNGAGHYGAYHFEYLKLQTTTSGYGIILGGSGVVTWQNVGFGACASAQIIVGVGCYAKATGNYSITGGSTNHIAAYDGGQIRVQSVTVTVTGTPAFSDCFANTGRVGTILATSITFSGSATGKRYNADYNGVMYTGGGGANYFPGNSAGTTSTGGQYN